jgi:hypothetical protein
LKLSDEVNEMACEHRPDESEKIAVTLSRASLTGGGTGEEFEPVMVDRNGVLWWE